MPRRRRSSLAPLSVPVFHWSVDVWDASPSCRSPPLASLALACAIPFSLFALHPPPPRWHFDPDCADAIDGRASADTAASIPARPQSVPLVLSPTSYSPLLSPPLSLSARSPSVSRFSTAQVEEAAYLFWERRLHCALAKQRGDTAKPPHRRGLSA